MKFDYIFRETAINLRRNVTLTIAAVVAVAVSLSLFGSTLLIRQAVDSGVRPTLGPAPASEAVFWWQFHEAAAAVVYWLTLIPVWHVRPWIGRTEWQMGSTVLALDARMLFLVLISTVAVLSVLRFSFVFVSRNKPAQVGEHPARSIRWVKAGDLLFAATLVIAGVTISAEHQGWAVLLVSLGLGSFVIAWFIEPLTERDALEALAAPMRSRRTGGSRASARRD